MDDQPALPSSKAALVAIDLGAESCRVSVLRWKGETPHMQLVHRFPNGAVDTADGLHWDLDAILRNLDEGLGKCADLCPEGIRSIAVDGWAVDYVRLKDGAPLAQPFCYRDERTVVAELALNERISAGRMRALTGIGILRINTAYQFFADSVELRALPWLNLPEYILYRLGARPVSERTNASHTQMLGLDGQWCAEILAELDTTIDAMPELVSPGTDVGEVRGALAAFPPFRGTRLVAPACHDTAAAIAAVPDTGNDWAYISSGTWSLVGTTLSAPNDSAQARAENFTNLAGVDDTICFHKNVNGMWLLRQCMESWQTDDDKPVDIARLVEDASQCPALPYMLDVDDPDLLLSGRMPQRINAQLHRRDLPELSTRVEDAPVMASLLFRSLAARYADVFRNVAEITGKQLRRVYIMGGGSQNQFLNRLTAEATGMPVIRVGTECSTVGNFASQLHALEPGSRSTSYWAKILEAIH